MAYRLALYGVRGGRIKDILAMDCQEMQGWFDYWQCEPFGAEWLQTASIQATVIQPHLKKGAKIGPADFMPTTTAQKEPDKRERDLALSATIAYLNGLKMRNKRVKE